ncbi:unnamed protein product [Adineta ricciae]|uniref:Peptidase C1A papain C-terminal domain-containing protein n=1 Tax=Adineta ricciae TaxID=249248 RepID=A0A815MXT3_ADIRI|nr:unnamed protein product [Adineta ricciae]CAF1598175.1 unnamed protein product [Adineta ricciae]
MPTSGYLIDRKTNKKYAINGCPKAESPPSDPRLKQKFSDHIRFGESELPFKVDLREGMTPVEQQEFIKSCVANAFAGAYEYLLKRTYGKEIDISRLFIYYNARVKDPNYNGHVRDKGCSITYALEALKECDSCLEKIWSYREHRKDTCPSDDAVENAANLLITGSMEIGHNLHEMKACLAQHIPFVFGLSINQREFQAQGKNKGCIQTPPENKPQPKNGHAMLAVGYSEIYKTFIVRNSWGPEWGDNGYCYIPCKYMLNQDLCYEIYAVANLEDLDDLDSKPVDKDGWFDEDETNYLEDCDNEEEYDIDDLKIVDGETEESEATYQEETEENEYN